MFQTLLANKKAKSFLVNELKQNRVSGTYLFYGKKGANLLEFAIAFTKALNCPELENDFCDVCSTCKKINSLSYADLEIVEDSGGIKIDKIREVILNASSSSYEGRKKVIILKDINKLRVESANALLKSIEEPKDGTFFILLSNSLNIIPTILSRSIIVEIEKLKADDYGISQGEYDFFLGDSDDINMYLKEKISLDNKISYREAREIVLEYSENPNIYNRVNLLSLIDDYLKNRDYLSEFEKIKFCENVLSQNSNREFIRELLHILIVKVKNPSKTEKLLELKNSLTFNVNTDLVFKLSILEL